MKQIDLYGFLLSKKTDSIADMDNTTLNTDTVVSSSSMPCTSTPDTKTDPTNQSSTTISSPKKKKAHSRFLSGDPTPTQQQQQQNNQRRKVCHRFWCQGSCFFFIDIPLLSMVIMIPMLCTTLWKLSDTIVLLTASVYLTALLWIRFCSAKNPTKAEPYLHGSLHAVYARKAALWSLIISANAFPMFYQKEVYIFLLVLCSVSALFLITTWIEYWKEMWTWEYFVTRAYPSNCVRELTNEDYWMNMMIFDAQPDTNHSRDRTVRPCNVCNDTRGPLRRFPIGCNHIIACESCSKPLCAFLASCPYCQ